MSSRLGMPSGKRTSCLATLPFLASQPPLTTILDPLRRAIHALFNQHQPIPSNSVRISSQASKRAGSDDRGPVPKRRPLPGEGRLARPSEKSKQSAFVSSGTKATKQSSAIVLNADQGIPIRGMRAVPPPSTQGDSEEMRGLVAKVIKMEERIDHLEKDSVESEKRLKELEKENKSLRKALEAVSKDMKRLKKGQDQLRASSNEVEMMEGEMSKLTEDLREADRSLDGRIHILWGMVERTGSYVMSYSKTKMSDDIEALSRKLWESSRKHYAELKTKVRTLEEIVAVLTKKLEEDTTKKND